MSQDKLFVWKSHQKQLGWAQKLFGANQQGMANSASQVVRVSDMAPHKETKASASTSVWEKAAPPALALMPDTLSPPRLPLVPFRLLPWCWSSGVSLSKSMCGPFKRNSQGFQQFLFSSASVPADFCSQKLWGPIFLVLEP